VHRPSEGRCKKESRETMDRYVGVLMGGQRRLEETFHKIIHPNGNVNE
jgi:hypothetical protein